MALVHSVIKLTKSQALLLLQGANTVKIVPRVLFELDQTGLMQLLSKPEMVQEVLVGICRKHKFDGLVSIAS